MKVSLNWMKQYGGQGLDVPVDELVTRIGAQLGEIEGVESLGAKYRGIVIAKVVRCDDHPDADRLHVCTIDDGGNTPDIKRDADGYVQVVCGAPNVRAGLLVAWLPPGSIVPQSVGKDPFVLEARELRGVVSNGMLASSKELALGDDHDGILEIDPTEWSPHQTKIEPGADFATVFGLNEPVIDIENKMFTHRPDCFGQLGVAREIAGINGQKFTSPSWYSEEPIFPNGDGLALEVVNESPELVPRLMTLTMKDVSVRPSPLWLQCALVSVGQKPVNNVVDVTNYVMLLTAQPTHAYDYDKVRGTKLVARLARPDEEITLLNHKTYKLDPADLVIADGDGAIGLAGVMGGGDSEVSESTINIILECATFDMYSVRRSSMRHGVFTDALTRFNKGQSPLQNNHVLHLLMQSIQDVAGGEVAGTVVDETDVADRVWVHPPVPLTAKFVNDRLGFSLTAEEMKRLLENVEFSVAVDEQKLTVTAPFWRTDVETREDVVEEIGRLYGYDHLPLELPERSIVPAAKNELLELKSRIRDSLRRAGANEVLTYSFVHGNLLDRAGQDKTLAFSLSNALSPDLQYYRLSLTPSLLAHIQSNSKAGFNDFAVFEIGKGHAIGQLDEAGLPKEFDRVALVVAADAKAAAGAGAAYYRAQHLALNALADFMPTTSITFVPLGGADLLGFEPLKQMVAPFEPGRSAIVYNADKIVGIVGEYRRSVAKALKLPGYCAGFELFLSAFQSPETSTYTPLSRFPKVNQDITLKVPSEVSYHDVRQAVSSGLDAAKSDQVVLNVQPLGIYQSSDDKGHKNISFRVIAVSYDKTLTDSEVAGLLDEAAGAAKHAVGAERI